MREKVAASFLAIWRRNQKSPRLALPLLKAADVLYIECGLEDLPATHFIPGENPLLFLHIVWFAANVCCALKAA